MKEPKFCYRHPARTAKRKCYQCSRPLCPECRIKLDHHLFCSNSCHRAYLAEAAAKEGKIYAKYAFYVAGLILISSLIYFALLADAFYSGGVQSSSLALNDMGPSLPVEIESATTNSQILTITSPTNGTKSSSQMVKVEGKGPAHAVIALYLNGTLVDSSVTRKNVYRFPHVLLTKKANVIQTRSYTDSGASHFSQAIMVLYQDPVQSNTASWQYFQNSNDNISRGNLRRKEMVLTFDGDSEANSCESILNVLKQNRVRATIFLSEKFIQNFPEQTRRVAAEQEAGSHIYTQLRETKFTREELHKQLQRTEEVYYLTTGRRMMPLWRTPYGEHNLEIRRWAAELGYMHVAWTANPKNRQNMDSLDSIPDQTQPGYFPAQLIKDRILSFGQNEAEQANGAIVLMHLGSKRKIDDRLDQWLPEIIKTFKQRGYRFITASDLIDRKDLLPSVAAAK